jgi:hypothetical protein
MSSQSTKPTDDGEGDWWKQWTPSEEVRRRYSREPWRPGERRWFASPNVIDLLEARRQRKTDGDPTVRDAR